LERKVSSLNKENKKLKEELATLDCDLSSAKNDLMEKLRLLRAAGNA